MCPQESSTHFVDVIGYSIPKLHEGKDWYVDFYALDPYTKKNKRKKYYISAPTKKEKRLVAKKLISTLIKKLDSGWNPWSDNGCLRGSKTFVSILDNYLTSILNNHRLKSIQTYSSKINVLKEFIELTKKHTMYAIDFDRAFVIDFLDWLINERGASPRTRNNYRGWLNSLATYMLERNYLSENFIPLIKNMRSGTKSREALSYEMLMTLFSYLRKNDKHFLLAVMMEYYTFIRPNELRHVKLKDISIKDMTIFVPAEVSKNKKDGKVAINEDIINLFIELNVFKFPVDYYLFGKDFYPSETKASADIFNKKFAIVRKHLKWPSKFKFYSLKDSGIRDLSEAKGIVTARDQARHQDITTTNKYLHGSGLSAPEKAKHFQGYLRAASEQ